MIEKSYKMVIWKIKYAFDLDLVQDVQLASELVDGAQVGSDLLNFRVGVNCLLNKFCNSDDFLEFFVLN